MTPEELAEARHYAACYQDGYVHDLMHNFLAHVDQQAARIEEYHHTDGSTDIGLFAVKVIP
jgi:hypothetical protein